MGDPAAMIPLGRSGILVSAIGYGSLPLSGAYGPADDRESVALMQYVLDAGVNMIDTSNIYGDGHVETLVGQAIQGRRDQAVIATKFGMQGPGLGRPEKVREALEGSLRRLRTDFVDVMYLHQIDPTTPIEDSVGAMAELLDEGKIRAIGLSEVTAGTLARAHATYPVSALQQEYSLIAREIETDLLPAARERGITLVAYSPLGRGLLTGTFRRPSDVPTDDLRRQRYPRFDGRSLTHNLRVSSELFQLARQLGTTPTELALGWVLTAHNTIPIPGTRSVRHFDAALDIARDPQDAEITRRLTHLFPVGIARGARYAPHYQQRLDEAP